jgi:hypothetical protein
MRPPRTYALRKVVDPPPGDGTATRAPDTGERPAHPLGGLSGAPLDAPPGRPARSDCSKLLARRPLQRYRIRAEGCPRPLELAPGGATAQINKHYASAPLGIMLMTLCGKCEMTKRRTEIRAKKAERRQRRLEAQGKVIDGVEVPDGAIPADLSEQAPACFSARHYYKDKEFKCVDCGAVEIWTAESQQWYFEKVKAHPASKAVRCSECRKKRQSEKEDQRRHMAKPKKERET